MAKNVDKDLGMNRDISRRDFINGAVASVGASVVAGSVAAGSPANAAPLPSNYNPPALQHLRGSHPGSFESAHAVRDANGWKAIQQSAVDVGEKYDLVVVGGGLSGLAAAHFYRKQHGANARILILDNHDDFGGHAKRNEFVHNGRTFIGYGGTEQIYHGPWDFSPSALSVLTDIGVETDKFYKAFDWTRYARMQLTEGVFFDKETFGRDHLAVGERQLPWAEFLKDAPLSPAAKADILRLYEDNTDYLPDMSVAQKLELLRGMTYNEFLLKVAKADPSVVPYFRSRTDRGTRPTDYTPALSTRSAPELLPGLNGMGLPPATRRWKRDPEQIFHFPDGNAGVARLLVRSLIPAALPAANMEESVTTKVAYGNIDLPTSPVRIRVSSIVVNVRHLGDPHSAKEVEVTYLNGGKAYRVKGANVIMACYNSMIPFLCPALPEPQKKALAFAVRSPLIYTNVLISNWRAWAKLGVHFIHSLTGYHHELKLDFPVDMGSHKSAASPDEPIVLHLEKRFFDPGPAAWKNPDMKSIRDRSRLGRAQLLAASYEEMELEIRSSLGRILGPGGFDPAQDILGITINRWPHGYAQGRDAAVDPEWKDGEQPWVIGRQRFGRIAIANSDAGASALTQTAFDQAYRAVNDLAAV